MSDNPREEYDAYISQLFENIEPDDFFRDTSAEFAKAHKSPVRGLDAFNEFVDQLRQNAAITYAASDGEMNPVAVLQTPEKHWMFTPDDDETNNMFFNRLSREANDHEANWFFVSMLCPIGIYDSEDEVPEVGSDDDITKAEQQGHLKEGLAWYAESVDWDDRRFGVFEVDGRRCTRELGGEPSLAPEMFTRVMTQRRR